MNNAPSKSEVKTSGSKLRIPIFIKLALIYALLIFLVISVISYFILKRQKQQFIDQLIGLGESMANVAASNAPDKLLGEEDLALFQLMKDIAKNEQVVYAAITNNEKMIKAHSILEEVNKPFSFPAGLTLIKEIRDVKVSSFEQGEREILFFERPIIYGGVTVGSVYLAVSQEKILRNIKSASRFILFYTVLIILFGIALSFAVSMYFSRPISLLTKGSTAIGNGDFRYKVNIRRNDELGDLGRAFNRMAAGLAEREMIRETFGKYVTPEIRDEILSGRIPLNGERRMATVLFADLRDFTPYVESSEPEEVVRSLRQYFTAMQKAIRNHDGLLLQYVGDQLEAIFGVPLSDPDHAKKALMASLDMRLYLNELNETRVKQGLKPFRHGVGVHTGDVLAGNTGSEDQLTYTLIGDTVNLASRIQSHTKVLKFDILASEETVKGLESLFVLEEGTTTMLKGYSKPIKLFKVMDSMMVA
ncbi:MAG: HAMP domain-containing protein [Desulfobacteraceae bacterium]|jgi:adenylate cyclase|nr:MAG: HAMP domain-containing protein [Desulfobacteraceae bacterium]